MSSIKSKIITKLREAENWIQNSCFSYEDDSFDKRRELEKSISIVRRLTKKLSEKMESINKLEIEYNSQRFGDYIRYVRKSKKKTLGYVALRLEISVAYLSQIELGDRSPFNDEAIKKFCEIFGQDYYFMLGLVAKERSFVRIGENRKLLKTKKPQLPEALLV